MYLINEVLSKIKMFMFHYHVETFMHFCEKVRPKSIIRLIFFFYLAAKHFNIFMAIQISKLIGFYVYMTQL